MLVNDPDWPPMGYFFAGLLFFGLAVGGVLTGEGLYRGGVVYRTEKPREFWELIASDFVFCALFFSVDVFNMSKDSFNGLFYIVMSVYIVYSLCSWLIRRRR
jgi:hypothetical protein